MLVEYGAAGKHYQAAVVSMRLSLMRLGLANLRNSFCFLLQKRQITAAEAAVNV